MSNRSQRHLAEIQGYDSSGWSSRQVKYLPTLGTALAGVWSPYLLVDNYAGPLVTVCATSAAATPVSSLDVYADPSTGRPNFAPAIAAYGNLFHVWKWYDQTPAANHAVSPTVASRFKVAVANKWGDNQPVTPTAGTEFAIIPNTLVTSRQALSSVHVLASRGMQDSCTMFSTGTGGSTTIFNAMSDFGGIKLLGNTFVPAPFYGRVTPSVYAYCAGTGNTKLHRNDNVYSGVALTAATGLLGGAIGGSHNAANTVDTTYKDAFTDVFAHMIYAGQVSDADMAKLKAVLYERFSIVQGSETTDYKMLGDSIGFGQSSSTGIGSPSRCLPYWAGKAVNVSNPSSPAKKASTILSNWSTYAGRHDATKARTIYHVQAGTNDVANSDSVASIQTTMQTLKTNITGLAGGYAVFSTIIHRGSVGYPALQANADAVNAWMRANLPAANCTVIDRASILTDSSNTTYYHADKVHLIDAGYQLVADFEGPILTGLMI